MVELPRGTVTFLFTDIEGSTRLLAEIGADEYAVLLEEHRARLRTAFARGYEVDALGDSLFFAFGRADEAVAAAAAGQNALAGLALRVRMGVHTGEPSIAGDHYVGLDVHRAARIGATAHGGQVVLSQSTRDLSGAATRDLGDHRLKDLTQPQRLYQLLAPGLETDFPPLQTLGNRPTNLPVQPTPLVGRGVEVEALRTLLCRDDVRLVTLTGPGGSGKTRLALHTAAEMVDAFPNGVWLVSLESVDDPELLLPTIAQTLGLFEAGAGSLGEALRDHLARQRLLLVLDNFEQLLDAARTVSDLLGDSPGLKLLVTSRAPLRLAAEHVFSVPPLLLPDPAAPATFETISRYAAVALFIQRAQAVAPSFAVTSENAPALAELCVRLDGLPLAIELAAARVKLLPPQALLGRLGRRLELLSGGPRDRPERHQTLRSTLDWSFELLGEAERRLFAQLAVFAGGFRLETAEQVCDANLDAVEALLEISLLRSQEQPDGQARFSMLETIRDYAAEQLERRHESNELRRRHAQWFAAWLEHRTERRAAGKLVGDWEPEDTEHENVRAALVWAREAGEIDIEVRLAAAAGRFYWPNRGFLSEGRRWLDDVLSRAQGAEEGGRALALLAAAHLAWRQGEHERCDELAAEAQPIFERLGDRLSLGSIMLARAIAAEWRGDAEAEAVFHDRAEWIFREYGQTELLDSIDNNRCYAEIVAGNYESAERRLRKIAEAERGEMWRFTLVNHGLALARLGRLDEAETQFAQALRRSIGTTRETEIGIYALEGLGTIAGLRREDERAVLLWGASAAIRETSGYALGTAERQFHDEVAVDVRARFGREALDRTWDEGRRLPADQMLELALGGS